MVFFALGAIHLQCIQSGGPQLSEMETALARIRMKITKKYQRDDDDGISYRYNDGSSLRLTPFLIKEWARAIVCSIFHLFFHQALMKIVSMTWKRL
jgi:hypothetical protein